VKPNVDGRFGICQNPAVGSVITPRTRVRFRADLASREIDGEFYVLTADSTFHSVTDPVGAFVLERVGTSGGGITVRRLVSAVEEEFDSEGRDVPADIVGFVAELVDKGILDIVR
jgi:hypothetical protein